MTENNQTVIMYYYFNREGVQLWTSNDTLALMRARIYDSEVFRLEKEVKP